MIYLDPHISRNYIYSIYPVLILVGTGYVVYIKCEAKDKLGFWGYF